MRQFAVSDYGNISKKLVMYESSAFRYMKKEATINFVTSYADYGIVGISLLLPDAKKLHQKLGIMIRESERNETKKSN